MNAAATVTAGRAGYRGRRVAFLTQHGKELLLGPLLAEAIGCQVERIAGFDTDTLGTFTRDIARTGSQHDAARTKARIGMQLGGCALGLGSEGTFGPDPFSASMPWNRELLVWLDGYSGLELTGFAAGPARSHHATVADREALERFARTAGFPTHHLVLRPDHDGDARITKGIAQWDALYAAFDAALAASTSTTVLVESDLRAHCNPTRQAMIRRAGDNLAAKLTSYCPGCAAPGWWIDERISGLPCEACGQPTREIRAERWACSGCGQREERVSAGPALADPGRCDFCNP